MTVRVNPPPSDDSDAKRLKMEAELKRRQVEKLEEVDRETRSRNRFQQMVEPNEEEESGPETTSSAPGTPAPSPFDTSFRSQKQPPLKQSIADPDQAIPSPPQSSMPLRESFATSEDPLADEDEALPQADTFYQFDYDQSPPPPEWIDDSKTRKFEEKHETHPAKKGKPSPILGKEKHITKEPSPFAPTPIKEQKAAPSPKKPHEEKKPVAATPHPGFEHVAKAEKKPVVTQQRPAEPVTKVAEPRKPQEPEEVAKVTRPPEKERREEKGSEKKTMPEIVSPTETPLPAQAQAVANVAAANAAPYISPEVIALYHQMVGTIYVMASPKGVSRTEFVLNNPKFANSKFYGSTIEITRYASAPDAFNIRLTGTNEAVAAFQQNAAQLQAAFKKQGITIGQLRVEYKPLFHRKEKGGDKGDKP